MSILKLLKITLSAIIISQSVCAQTVVNIPRGNSFTAMLVFNSSYDPARIKDISVTVGARGLADSSIKATSNSRQFRVEITSNETRSFSGRNDFIVSVQDSVLGVRKTIPGVLNFTEAGRYSGAVVSTGVDWTISINITSAGITSNATLATIFKGDKGDKGDTGATGPADANAQNPNFSVATGVAGSNVSVSGSYPNLTLTIPRGADGANATNPNFTAATGAAGSSVMITGTYPNLTLTVPRGDTGATGAAGSDATVTSGNIASALGFTPVSPTQLGVKQDTSASITTAKISDWTTAWAARFAAQSTSNLTEGTNLYHTTARVQAVGDARYLPLSGGILTNASTYQLRLAYDSNNYLSFTVNSTGTTTLQPTGTNAGINLNTTGTGVVGLGASIVPSTNNSHDLGSYLQRMKTIWAEGTRIDIFRSHNGVMSFRSTIDQNLARMFNNGNWIFGPSGVDNGNKVTIEGTLLVTSKINMDTGANKALNTVTLSGGTVTVNNTLVTASSIISLTYQNCSNCGTVYISAKTAGTSFVITSTNASDASIIAYEIKN